MIVLFLGRAFHAAAGLRQLRRQGLTLVEPLGTDFAGMVDAHQARDIATLLVPEFGVRQAGGGVGALGDLGRSKQGADGLVEADHQLVRGSEITILHGGWQGSEVAGYPPRSGAETGSREGPKAFQGKCYRECAPSRRCEGMMALPEVDDGLT